MDRNTDIAMRLNGNPGTGCLEFTGSVGSHGYGQIRVGSSEVGSRRTALTHRLAWELVHGPIPDGLWVLHKCDNRRCCNVEHLFLGTQADNLADMARKGRGTSGPLPYGVCRERSGRWSAKSYRGGKTIHLGTYDTIEQAAAVSAEFKRATLGCI